MKPQKPLTITAPLIIIALVVIISVGVYLVYALVIGNQPVESTSSSANTIEEMIEELDQKYDFVQRATTDVVSQNPLINALQVNETDIIVDEPGVKGAPPIFRIANNEIISVNYPGSYDLMSIQEFQGYLENIVNPNAIPDFAQEDQKRGWYYGDKNQKKSGTPDNWQHRNEGTLSAQWYDPDR